MDKHAQDTVALCRRLAAFTEEEGHITRRFLSPPMRDVHRELASRMERLGMAVSVDAVGNLRGYYPAQAARAMQAPQRLLIGSHLDTVPHAGAFDGILGVAMGIALVDALAGRRLRFGIEVVGFSEEEGVRFGVPFIGSRALVGAVDDALLNLRDPQGVSVAEAIRGFGLDLALLSEAKLSNDTLGYLEFHIEQGPVLEEHNFPLGVVTTIVGQSRLRVTFTGRAGHAGTTPMNLRRDALTGAAEWIGLVESMAGTTPELVATVGQMEIEPGASNVIPGAVHATLDVRHADDTTRHQMVAGALAGAKRIASNRGLIATWQERMNRPATNMSKEMVSRLDQAIQAAGFPLHHMTSGAGHDAMILAGKVSAAMLFVRSPGGVSHHPDENVHVEDVAAALRVGLNLLEQWEERRG